MHDREKVIKGLEHCKKYGSLGGNNCNGYYEYTDNLQEIIKANNHRKDCPYGQCRTGCVVTLVADALALLKGQESGAKGGCDGCIYKGSNDCQLDQTRDGNVVCPNGKLNIT